MRARSLLVVKNGHVLLLGSKVGVRLCASRGWIPTRAGIGAFIDNQGSRFLPGTCGGKPRRMLPATQHTTTN